MPTYARHPVTIDDATVDEMQTVAVELGKLESGIASLGERLYRVGKEFSRQSRNAELFDDEFEWLREVTGYNAMFDAVMRVMAPLAYATECGPGDNYRPEWYIGLRCTDSEGDDG